MDRKTCYCVFYVFLLMTVTPAMCRRRRAKVGKSEKVSEKRQLAAALLPSLPSIAGTAVAPWLFLALVAAYGVAALVQYSITENTSEDKCWANISCAGGRGRCRDPKCWAGEYPLWSLSDVCGGLCPCCVVDDVYKVITGNNPPLGK